jgi:hypothetical protein
LNRLAIHGPQLFEEAGRPLRSLFQFSFESAQNQPVSTDSQRPGTLVNGFQKFERDVNAGTHEYVCKYTRQASPGRGTFGDMTEKE